MNTNDEYQDAMNAKVLAYGDTAEGQITVQVYACVLQKGVGKMPFDPTMHKESEKRTAVDMFILPLDSNKSLERRMVAQSDEWVKIVLPSLKDCGILDLRTLNGKYVRVKFEKTGRKYADKTTGEEKEATTFKFIAIYNTEAELQAANGGAAPAQSTAPAAAASPAQGGNGGNAQRDVALKFLPTMVKSWCSQGLDPEKVRAGLAANPLLSKHFTIDSPEVVAEMMKQVPA